MSRVNPSLRTRYNPHQHDSYDHNNEVNSANENNENNHNNDNNDNNGGTDNIEVDSDNIDIDVNVNDKSKNSMDDRQAKYIAEVMADEHREGITDYVTPNPQHNCMVSKIDTKNL